MPINPDKRATTRIACPQHAAPILAAELDALGYDTQHEHSSGVEVGATLLDCMELALCLRTATHVAWQLTRFRCPSPKALYKETAAFPWEELIPADGYLTVRAATDTRTIDNQMYPALVVKDAIVDRMMEKHGRRPDAGPDRTGVCLNLYWQDDRAGLFLNINGRPLSHRGYRKLPHHAPMRETLAAAVLLASGYNGTTPLVNPMCGSGTLAIEAALIATNRAPGLLRPDYAIQKTALDLEDDWKQARADAKSKPVTDIPAIIATDHDPEAIDAARKNARVAGVEHLIDFQVCDFRDTPIPSVPGHIILNPEYGERMGENEELVETYKAIGDLFKQRCPGFRAHIFTGSPVLAKRVGLKTSRRQAFRNATIECRLLTYDIYTGTGRQPS